MSLEEEKLYIPTKESDGVWQLTFWGDSGALGKKIALSYDEDFWPCGNKYSFHEFIWMKFVNPLEGNLNSLVIPKFVDVRDPVMVP